MELPSGTVTFLFTDLEGPARLWDEHPDGMRAALARHDEILREVIAKHDGYVLKTARDHLTQSLGTRECEVLFASGAALSPADAAAYLHLAIKEALDES